MRSTNDEGRKLLSIARRGSGAMAHHYDVSNAFYRHVLGPSMTYSCALWSAREMDLKDAQDEVRHVESLREHYALTLRAWVTNLERTWDSAVAEAGVGRARVWKLYMAGSALGFEENRIQVHQTLAGRSERGRSGMELRPRWEDASLAPSTRPEIAIGSTDVAQPVPSR